jgi:exonuclease III
MKVRFLNADARRDRRVLEAQILALRPEGDEPDIVALCEVRTGASDIYRDAFQSAGYEVETRPTTAAIGFLVASRFPLQPADDRPGTRPERMFSLKVDAPFGRFELLVVHAPHFGNDGVTKLETIDSVCDIFDARAGQPFLCVGDFNTPIYEEADGGIVTGAYRLDSEGDRTSPSSHRSLRRELRQDERELRLWADRGPTGVRDVRRQLLCGKALTEGSYEGHGNRRAYLSPFDRAFATPALAPVEFRYDQTTREQGLSVHAIVEILFDPQPA